MANEPLTPMYWVDNILMPKPMNIDETRHPNPQPEPTAEPTAEPPPTDCRTTAEITDQPTAEKTTLPNPAPYPDTGDADLNTLYAVLVTSLIAAIT